MWRFFFRFLLVLGLIGFLGLSAVPRAQAQKKLVQPKKYAHVPFEGNFEEALKALIKDVEGQQNFNDKLAEWIKKFQESKDLKINPDELKNIDLKNPLIQKQIQKILEQPALKELNLDPKKAEQFKEVLKKFEIPKPEPEKPVPPDGNEPPDGMPPMPPDQQPEQPPIPPDQQPPMVENNFNPDSEPEDPFAEWFENWLGNVEESEVGKMLLESPAFQKMILEWNFTDTADYPKLLGFDSHDMGKWFENMPRVDWPGGLFQGKGFNLGNANLPSFPKFQVYFPKMGAPSFGGLGPGSGGGSTLEGVVLIVVMAAGTILILCFLVMNKGVKNALKGEKGWRLGPWPVNPGLIRTQGELVQAFDYLALLVLGQKAQNWNHRMVAQGIGGEGDAALMEKWDAANQLATMYEQARYAPAGEPLAEAEILRSRGFFLMLSGAAKA